MKNFFESFQSVASMIATIDTRQTVDGMRESSQNTDSSAVRFTGTESYQQATELALHGDEESMKKVQASVLRLRSNIKTQRTQNRVCRCVAGSRPCVAAAVIGQPNSMYRRITTKVQKPVITLFYSMTACGGVDKQEIVDTGARLASAIQVAERSGVRVNLFAGVTARTKKEQAAVFVKVKDSSKDFDLLRMSYVLINSSFLRRHYFRWLETKEGITARDWWSGYGRPLSQDEEKEIIKELEKNGNKLDKLLSFETLRYSSVEDIAKMITGQAK